MKEEVLFLSVKDQSIARRLIEKYGDDYEKMARDIKINVEQLTAGQLERLIIKYKKLLQTYDEPEPAKEDKDESENEDDDASLLEFSICLKQTMIFIRGSHAPT